MVVAARSHMMNTYRRWPVEFVSGRGATLFDSSGRSYVDLVAGIAVASVGHAHPQIAAAIASQASTLVHVSNLYRTGAQERLAQRLASLTNGKSAFFCNSGAEAVECALKLARKYGMSKNPAVARIVAADNSFHGRTFGALAATGQPGKQAPFGPMLEGFVHVPYGDAGALSSVMGEDVAAVLFEPVQGEAGVIVPAASYLQAARALCDEHGALLIFDEVQTGLGRTGKWFAYEHFGVEPDVVCVAKALAGGLPMGACLASAHAAVFDPGDHASTFGGGPVQSAAALATLDVIEQEGLIERAAVLGDALARSLERIFRGTGKVRGLGLLLAVELADIPARDVAERCLAKGVLVNDATPVTLRLTPPLVISEEELDSALTVISEVMDEIRTA